jgi:hypothetical protein
LGLFGGEDFSYGFTEGGSAGTATGFKVMSSTGYGSLISDLTDLT